MDDKSEDDDRDELRSGRGGESRNEWWGWRNAYGSWFQRRGDAYLNERSVIFKEEMIGGRQRATTVEERVKQLAYVHWKIHFMIDVEILRFLPRFACNLSDGSN